MYRGTESTPSQKDDTNEDEFFTHVSCMDFVFIPYFVFESHKVYSLGECDFMRSNRNAVYCNGELSSQF